MPYKPKAIPFPKTAAPGQQPSEGAGSLVNCSYEKRDGVDTWRRVPGFDLVTDAGFGTPRGAIDVNGTLYWAAQDKAVTIDAFGGVTTIPGTLSGSNPVTWARNNRAPTPDVVCVTELGPFVVSASSIAAYPDPDLPTTVNSVSFLDGYHLFTEPAGKIYASDLNATTMVATSFASASSKPDGIVRGVVVGSNFLAMGSQTIEAWQDVGASPFPLQRAQTIPVGLIGQWAVAGFEDGWSGDLIFVANDSTVRRLVGYDPQEVSTPDVRNDIAAVVDKSTLRASVHVSGGRSYWVLSSPTWTWTLCVSNGSWFKRKSANLLRWRGDTSVYYGNRWLVGDTTSSKVFAVSETSNREGADDITAELVAVMRSNPARLIVGKSWFDFTTAQGNPAGSAEEQDPTVMVSWSKDGGATWSGDQVARSLGDLGQFSQRIKVDRIGLTTHHGLRWRLRISAPVYFQFRGGTAEIEAVT